MDPFLIDTGFLKIRWYGAITALAFLSGFFVFSYLIKRIRKEKFNEDRYLTGVLITVILALVGGRLVHVLTFLRFYLENPLEIFSIWKGGIAFYGVFCFGIFGVYLLSKKVFGSGNRLTNFLCVMDMGAVALALSQTIGRWGNWFNGELFGMPCDKSFCIPIEALNRPEGYLNFSHFHPVFLYESVLMLLVFVFLFLLFKRRYFNKAEVRVGVIFASYLIFHGLIRFCLELFRIDAQPVVLFFRLFGWVALLEMVIGILILCFSFRRKSGIMDLNSCD